MKANRKFLGNDEEAVSPVIAVILMVAITVVLAATVYVWVSGFNTGTSSTRSISFTSGGALTDAAVDNKKYVIASASPGFKWNELNFTLDGATLNYATSGASGTWCLLNSAGTCKNGGDVTTIITAGEEVKIYHSSLSGKTLRALDKSGNNVLATIVVS